MKAINNNHILELFFQIKRAEHLIMSLFEILTKRTRKESITTMKPRENKTGNKNFDGFSRRIMSNWTDPQVSQSLFTYSFSASSLSKMTPQVTNCAAEWDTIRFSSSAIGERRLSPSGMQKYWAYVTTGESEHSLVARARLNWFFSFSCMPVLCQ